MNYLDFIMKKCHIMSIKQFTTKIAAKSLTEYSNNVLADTLAKK